MTTILPVSDVRNCNEVLEKSDNADWKNVK